VQLEGKTFFVLQSQLGGLSAQERARRMNQNLREFADNPSLSLDELEIYTGDKDGIPLTLMSAGNISLIAIATIALIVAVVITNNTFARIYQRLKVWGESYIRPVRLGNWELIRANQLDNILTWLVRFAQAAIILGLLVFYFPFVLEQFPWTRGLGKVFEGYLVGTLQSGWQALVNYLPSLLTILLVVAVTYFLLRALKLAIFRAKSWKPPY
jgi:hypothetical protein